MIPRPTTRLLALLELLQSRDLISGAELAQRLEIDRRSVRRYIQMLDEIGVPVETVRGPHGGYRLRPGRKIPPLLLTDDEVIALALALQAMPQLGLALEPGVAAGLRAKLERILPAGLQAQMRALERGVGVAPVTENQADSALIATLSAAAHAGRQMQLAYCAEDRPPTNRLIDPYGVARWSRAWYLVAYCHLRAAIRLFRLDRIATATTLTSRFTAPTNFDPYAYVAQAMVAYPGRWAVKVTLTATPTQLAETDLAHYGTISPAPTGPGTIFTGQFDCLDGIARRLIATGYRFTVNSPPELRTTLHQIAAQLLAT